MGFLSRHQGLAVVGRDDGVHPGCFPQESSFFDVGLNISIFFCAIISYMTRIECGLFSGTGRCSSRMDGDYVDEQLICSTIFQCE